MPVPGVGEQAPDFTLKDQNNLEATLSSFRGDKAVLLIFYPFAFTGTCQGELTEIREDLDRYQNERTQVLTISVDSQYAHKRWAQDQGFAFPLLSDFWPHGGVARSYGVLNEDNGFALRGTFLVDADGVVRLAEVNGPGEARDPSVWARALAELDTPV